VERFHPHQNHHAHAQHAHPGHHGGAHHGGGSHGGGDHGGGDGGDKGAGDGMKKAEELSQQIFGDMIKSFMSGQPPDFSKAGEAIAQEMTKDIYGGQK
jgi:hypothetical protein